MKSVNNKKQSLELVDTISIPPYDLSVPKDVVTERKIELPTGKLFFKEL